ncbi:MAG: diadenylate cyclase [Minisyncoccia bacterium]
MTASFISFFKVNPFSLRIFLSSLQFKDVLDIIFTAFLVYLSLWFLRRTKSLPAIIGVVILLLSYAVSYWLNLSLTYKILQTLLGAFIVILVVIFQEEIKRFFYLIGSVGGRRNQVPFSLQTIDSLAESIFIMANRRIGALIVIPGQESIWPYVTGGIEIDARLSNPLILSLFDTHSPGHDGAVVLENDQIKKFAVYLPLSKDLVQLKNYGTRHRAGLGLSERTDALSVMVSEEKGTVTVAQNGVLKPISDKEELISFLKKFLEFLNQNKKPYSFLNFIKSIQSNVLLALISLIFTAFVWILISYPNLGIIQKNFIAQIEFTNINNTLAVENIKPLEVIATFSGRSQDFKLLDPNLLKVSIDLNNMTVPDKYTITLNQDNLKYPSALNLVNLDPKKVQFTLVTKENLQLQNTTTSPAVKTR